MSKSAEHILMKEAWEARNSLYKELLGDYTSVMPSRYEPPEDSRLLRGAGSMGADTGDPKNNEKALALLTYAPDPLRHYWTYLTAGLSNPWFQDEPQEVSGFGCELLIKTPADVSWPHNVLRSMAFHVFNSAGTLSPGKLVRLNLPVSFPDVSRLNNFFIWYADEAPDAWYQLPSGGFGIFVAVGITEDECSFAESIEEYGTWCIQEVLRQVGIGQITDHARTSVMERENIGAITQSVSNYARNFRLAHSPLNEDNA